MCTLVNVHAVLCAYMHVQSVGMGAWLHAFMCECVCALRYVSIVCNGEQACVHKYMSGLTLVDRIVANCE